MVWRIGYLVRSIPSDMHVSQHVTKVNLFSIPEGRENSCFIAEAMSVLHWLQAARPRETCLDLHVHVILPRGMQVHSHIFNRSCIFVGSREQK